MWPQCNKHKQHLISRNLCSLCDESVILVGWRYSSGCLPTEIQTLANWTLGKRIVGETTVAHVHRMFSVMLCLEGYENIGQGTLCYRILRGRWNTFDRSGSHHPLSCSLRPLQPSQNASLASVHRTRLRLQVPRCSRVLTPRSPPRRHRRWSQLLQKPVEVHLCLSQRPAQGKCDLNHHWPHRPLPSLARLLLHVHRDIMTASLFPGLLTEAPRPL